MTRDRLAAARHAIEREDTVCYDVAADVGQIFANVRRMRWFVVAVAKALGEHDPGGVISADVDRGARDE